MNFLFACGGTAGHINPALSIAEELQKRTEDAKILFVGAGRDMEKKLIPNAGYELVNIKMSGIKRGFSPKDLRHNVKTLKNLILAGGKAERIIKKFAPDAVIGTGGYICYPVLKKAAKMNIPTVIHESNAIPGLTTKMLSSTVDKVLTAFPGLENEYKRPGSVVFTGTPVRGGFESIAEDIKTQDSSKKPLVLSFWGSLGAGRMNEIITEFIRLNINNESFDHIHAVGRDCNVTEIKNKLAEMITPDVLPDNITVTEYIDDMHTVMSKADLILCRAGGSTLAELTSMGKPAVLIPSPYVSNDEQIKNARQLQKAGGAVIIEEKNCTAEILFNTVTEILNDKDRLERMASAQLSIGVPGATKKIAELILSLCKGS